MKRVGEALRRLLKKPLGPVAGSAEAASAARRAQAKGHLVVTVGDSCTLELIRRGVMPNIVVYDHRCQRKPLGKEELDALDSYDGEYVRVSNPAGFISDGLEAALSSALWTGEGKILVDGEEDLAALPAIMGAPEGTLVIYGQPDEGAVLVEVTKEKKRKAREIYSRLESV